MSTNGRQDSALAKQPFDFLASPHLIFYDGAAKKMKTITERQKPDPSASLAEIYVALIDGMLAFFEAFEEVIKSA